MMEPRLQRKLGELESALRRVRLWRRLALCWLAAAAFCILLILFHEFTGWNSRLIWALPLAAGAVAALVVWIAERGRPTDFPGWWRLWNACIPNYAICFLLLPSNNPILTPVIFIFCSGVSSTRC